LTLDHEFRQMKPFNTIKDGPAESSVSDPWVFDPDLPLSKNMFPGSIEIDPEQLRQAVDPRKRPSNQPNIKIQPKTHTNSIPETESPEENPTDPGIPGRQETGSNQPRTRPNPTKKPKEEEPKQEEPEVEPEVPKNPARRPTQIPAPSPKPKPIPKPPTPKPTKPLVTESQFKIHLTSWNSQIFRVRKKYFMIEF
jgi:hypothetical protein